MAGNQRNSSYSPYNSWVPAAKSRSSAWSHSSTGPVIVLASVMVSVALVLAVFVYKSKHTNTAALSLAKANSVAAAVNLQAADVPGFTGSPQTQTAQDQQAGDQVARCAGATPPSSAVADVNSDQFSTGSGFRTEWVGSDVTAMPSAQLVGTDLAAMKSAKARQCFAQFARSQISASAGPSIHVTGVVVQGVSTNAPGAQGSFGYRFMVSATVHGTPFRVYIDELGFAQTNYEVSLNTMAFNRPFPAMTEQKLFGVLVSRAKAATH